MYIALVAGNFIGWKIPWKYYRIYLGFIPNL